MNMNNHTYLSPEVLIDRAKEFAIEAHWGQMYGTKPYLHHLAEVAGICSYYKLPDYVVAAAYLHDVVEDTDITGNQVSGEFGYEVATLVHSVTDEETDLDYEALVKKINNDHGLKEDCHRGITDAKRMIRNDKKKKTYPKILAHPYGVYLKLADRIANVSACSTAKDTKMFEKYCSEGPAFEKALKTPAIAEEMWAELNKLYGKHKK